MGEGDVPVRRAGRHPAVVAGEPRFVYARDTRLPQDAPLVFLADGAAASYRADCWAGYLACPYPGCGARFAGTRAGRKRHCFFHPRSGAKFRHEPETYFHLIGKELMLAWARQLSCGAAATLETVIETGQRPDVLLVLPGGARIAFEIQYSAITAAEAQRRHQLYASVGIRDVWLLGHIPPHLRLSNSSEEFLATALSDAHRALLSANADVYFISPEASEGALIGTAWSSAKRVVAKDGACVDKEDRVLSRRADVVGWRWRSDVRATTQLARLQFDPLTQCGIEGGRFVTPENGALIEERERIEALTSEYRAALEKDRKHVVPIGGGRKWQTVTERSRRHERLWLSGLLMASRGAFSGAKTFDQLSATFSRLQITRSRRVTPFHRG